MPKIILYLISILLFLTKLSIAEVITNVKVEGNKRITKESVIVFGDIKLNTEIDNNELDLILKKII